MTPRRELEDRVALVTGAGSGIGRAAAVLMARHGAIVGLLGRTEGELRAVERAIAQAGGRAHTLVADVSEETDVARAVTALVEAAGRLDVVFANAGVNGVWAPIEKLEPRDWRHTFDINLHGTFFTIKYRTPHLKRRGGSVVVCSSVNGTRMFSNTGATAYACSKAAQAAMAKMLAVELGRDKIRVNVVCPGAIETSIADNTEQRDVDGIGVPVDYPKGPNPLTEKAPGTADQVAELVLFLASDRSSHVNGTEIWIDGGQSLVQG